MDKADEMRRYQEEMGKEALDRQTELASASCHECGHGNHQHHPACKRGKRLAAAKAKEERGGGRR